MKLIQLDIAALKQSDSQNNAYVMLLKELEGHRQLPIVIGWCEARSIAIALDNENPPERPLTHDLFLSLGSQFDFYIAKVLIHSLNEGIFLASCFCKSMDGKEIEMDTRTSDAVALAIRFKCPIFTTEDVLKQAGIVIQSPTEDDFYTQEELPKLSEKDLSLEELEALLQIAIEEEDFEKASELRDRIKKLKQKRK